jgi:hypothetical protein
LLVRCTPARFLVTLAELVVRAVLALLPAYHGEMELLLHGWATDALIWRPGQSHLGRRGFDARTQLASIHGRGASTGCHGGVSLKVPFLLVGDIHDVQEHVVAQGLDLIHHLLLVRLLGHDGLKPLRQCMPIPLEVGSHELHDLLILLRRRSKSHLGAIVRVRS